MKSLANAMNNVGGTNENFVRSMEQITQMVGKGKLMSDDLRVIAESFPQIRKYLGEAFGTADPEAIAKKGFTAIEVMRKLNEVMEKAPKSAAGAQAAQDNFRQSLDLFQSELGKNVLPKITDFLNKTTNLMDNFGKLSDSTKGLIGEFAMGGIGLLGIAFAFKTLGIELGVVSSLILKNPLLMSAVLGYAGGASISNMIKIPGLEPQKSIEAIPRTKTQNAKNQLGMANYELDAMKAVRAGIGANLAIAETPKTLADWLDWQKNWGGDKTFSGDVFPAYSGEYLKSTQRTNSPYSPYDTYKGAFSGTMANFMPSRRAFSGVPQAISDLSTFNKGWQGGSGGASMAGGTVSDRSFLHQQETQWLSDSYKTKLAIYEAEKAYDKADIARFEDNIDVMENSWDTFFEKNKQSVAELDRAWVNNLSTWIGIIDSASTLMIGFLEKLGMDTNSATTKHLSGMLSGAGQGVVTGAMIGSAVPVIGTVTGAVVGGIIGGVAGYDTGGIAWHPQLAKVAESEPEMIMPLSKMRNSGMGGTHIEIHNITVPDTWDRSKIENVVVQAIRDGQSHGRL
jgi:tape measure domain-containing protein